MIIFIVVELIVCLNCLGVDLKNINYVGGNIFVKGMVIDFVMGQFVELFWVKGFGGDFGMLIESGFVVFCFDRMWVFVDVYFGVDCEDEMVVVFDYCLYGKGGVVLLIDIVMYGFVDVVYVDYLYFDFGIVIVIVVDGEVLIMMIFGDKVVWVFWWCFGFQFGFDIVVIKKVNLQVIGCIFGGYGIMVWGDIFVDVEINFFWIIDIVVEYIVEYGKDVLFGVVWMGFEVFLEVLWCECVVVFVGMICGIVFIDKFMVGYYIDFLEVFDFFVFEKVLVLVVFGMSCFDYFLCIKVKLLIFDFLVSVSVEEQIVCLYDLYEQYCVDYQVYYDVYVMVDLLVIWGVDFFIVFVFGVGMFFYGVNKQIVCVVGEFYVNVINVMCGVEVLLIYFLILDVEKFCIEYWVLEEVKLQWMLKLKLYQGCIVFVMGVVLGIGKVIVMCFVVEGVCVVVVDFDFEKVWVVVVELGSVDVVIGVVVNVVDVDVVQVVFDEVVFVFGGVDFVVNNVGLLLLKLLLEMIEKDWDLQYDVMVKGFFLVLKVVVCVFIDQKFGGDIIYILLKNFVFVGLNNIVYFVIKVDQVYQVCFFVVELGEFGICVNGINFDGVVCGFGIFVLGWGVNCVVIYGVKEEDFGQFYVNCMIFKCEVVLENVVDVVYVFMGFEFSCIMGLYIFVDFGVVVVFF